MSVKNILTVVAILLIVVLAVGLVICRPMAAKNYASGIFNFEAVSEIRVRAWEGDAGDTAEWLVLTEDDPGFRALIDLTDGKGFGRAPGSLFSEPDGGAADGDRCWQVSFLCALSGGQLDMRFSGDILRLAGDKTVTVTTQDKSSWAGRVYDLILSLYPEPEPDPEDSE